MKLSAKTKETIYYKVLKTLDIKPASQYAEELQEQIDKEQSKDFVEFYKSTLKRIQGQRVSFRTLIQVNLDNYYADLFVEDDFARSERFKEMTNKVKEEIRTVNLDLKQLRETILAVDSDKSFLILFPQWEPQLLESLPMRTVNLPTTVADVSYLDKYKKAA